ncbi:MAG TPA: hypothetical protein VNT58_03960 [Gaiellaceae bacterium]|nr:hypothetical protein [Gaiellaceae bacterium]
MDVAAPPIKRQLGRIMVEEGFVTPDQLAQALAVQRDTGRPLGQVLVELGFVSAGAVANALAEQHGGILKTEFGVSTGLRRVPPPPTVQPGAPAPPAAPQPDARQRQLRAEIDVLRDHCETLRRGVAMLEAELERVRDLI